MTLLGAATVAEMSGQGGEATWILLATMLLHFARQEWRDFRDRRWQKQDAEEKRKLEQNLIEHEQAACRARAVLINKIDENTAISKDAFAAANDVNDKLLRAQETVAGAAKTVEKAAEVVAKAAGPEQPRVQT
jgi:hypothetical protein